MKKIGVPKVNTSRRRGENQQTQSRIVFSPVIELGPHWWEASALTTAPNLFPRKLRSEYPEKKPLV